ncbi:MAG: hypothetical protein AMJ92_06005 [candidate division Zixibacteria bacterium SM23_81]|nr:MAG: hypothetical protein AMJ92_06005 [candidate division Zixibacteria bacterium SM23_81]
MKLLEDPNEIQDGKGISRNHLDGIRDFLLCQKGFLVHIDFHWHDFQKNNLALTETVKGLNPLSLEHMVP